MVHSDRAIIAVVALIWIIAPARVNGHEPAETPAQIAELIRQLDNESFRVRETAQTKLLAIGLPALPALRTAVGSKAPELRARAASAGDVRAGIYAARQTNRRREDRSG